MSSLVAGLIAELEATGAESISRTLDDAVPLGELERELGPGERAWAPGAATQNVLWMLERYRLVADLEDQDQILRLWVGRRLLD